MTLDDIFRVLWDRYRSMAPIAQQCRRMLHARGEAWVVDHVALRTFDTEGLGLDSLTRVFTQVGYVETGRYRFSSKRLHAVSLSDSRGERPRVFISCFETNSLPEELRQELLALVSSPEGELRDWFRGERPWRMPSFETYARLREESEYAAWLSVFGICANHFTVAVNALRTISTIRELNRILREAGVELNEAGGEVKGSPELLLEQSSTMADRVPVSFSCGRVEEIRSCYMEFAARYEDPKTGTLFDGFLPESADRIFESTDEVQ